MSPPLLSKPTDRAVGRQTRAADNSNPALYRVLFISMDNSAASIMAEKLLIDIGKGWFEAFSAGPASIITPHALMLDVLASYGLPTNNIDCKSWTDFIAAGAPEMDIIVAIGTPGSELAVHWPGSPIVVPWSLGDPVVPDGGGAAQRNAFEEIMLALQMRITLLVSMMITEPADDILRKKLIQVWPAVGSARPEGLIHE
jgi:arsenate reductase